LSEGTTFENFIFSLEERQELFTESANNSLKKVMTCRWALLMTNEMGWIQERWRTTNREREAPQREKAHAF
jgi:hypothetical protein